MTNNQLILAPLRKALTSLHDALAQPKDEYIRDAVIQRFKCAYELVLKILKNSSSSNADIVDKNIKNLFQDTAQLHLIQNPGNWVAYHMAKTHIYQAYDEKIAEETYFLAKKFSADADFMLKAYFIAAI